MGQCSLVELAQELHGEPTLQVPDLRTNNVGAESGSQH